MDVSAKDLALISAIQGGLPLDARPYEAVGRTVGMTEAEVIDHIRQLVERGVIRRLGLVLSHRELGYRANAMVVWDIPDARIKGVGEKLAALPYITLCYRRPRRAPAWPYNLFCMIHGRDRKTVEALAEEATVAAGTSSYRRAILFSTRQFKQCGARYAGNLRDAPAKE